MSNRFSQLSSNCNIMAMVLQEYGVSVENIFAVEPDACPSLDEIKKLPNKVLLWCGKSVYTFFSGFLLL